jgi:UPF0271 protein
MDRIDLNSDLGEGFGIWRMGEDEALLGLVSSASIACGFHAGDPTTMQATVAAAVRHGVGIGAHPSFADLQGFGRRMIPHRPDELAALTLYQVGALQAFASAAGGRVRHVKAHGAMAHAVDQNSELAQAFSRSVQGADPDLILLVMPGGELERAAQAAGVPVAREVFADRGYDERGKLLLRGTPGALIQDPAEAAERALRMVGEQALFPAGGGRLPTRVDSVCVHGDTPGAVRVAEAVRARLEKAGIAVMPFTG